METKVELKSHLYVSILCGGGGTRLWPRSRRKTPKQFMELAGEKPAFLEAVKRAKKLTSVDKIFVITNADYVDEIISMSDLSLRNIFPEPEKRNTALAMASAAAVIEKRDSQAVIINLPSDYFIGKDVSFEEDMMAIAGFVQENSCLALIGTKPTFPHTGFGYVQVDKKPILFMRKEIFKISKFKEKPELEAAKKYFKDGSFYWNASFYTWKASVLLAACQKYAPEVYLSVRKIQEAWGTKIEQGVLREVYSQAESISIDYAVSEKADNLYLVPSAFTWTDLGNWREVWEVSKKDKDENAVFKHGKGELINIESKNCLIDIKDKLVALVGVEDLAVVETDDALLVVSKKKAQDVKKVVNFLKEGNKTDYL